MIEVKSEGDAINSDAYYPMSRDACMIVRQTRTQSKALWKIEIGSLGVEVRGVELVS